VYRERELAGLRTLTRASFDAAAAANGNGAPPEEHQAPETALDVEGLVSDVRWSFLALNGAPLDDGMVCYVAGDRAIVDAVEHRLAEELPASVRRLDRLALRNLGADVVADAPAFSSSLGLALREASPSNTLGVNFRRGEYTFHATQQELRKAVRAVVVLGVIVVALTLVDMGMKRYELAQQVVALDSQIQRVFSATLPELGRVANPKAVLLEQTDALRKSVDILNDIVPVSSSTSIDILRAAAAALPAKIRIDCEDYTMDPDAVRVSCNTDTFEAVDTIKEELLQTGYFSEVEVKGAKASAKGTGVDFRLTLKLNKDFRPRTGGHP